jgi:hypothetical protein
LAAATNKEGGQSEADYGIVHRDRKKWIQSAVPSGLTTGLAQEETPTGQPNHDREPSCQKGSQGTGDAQGADDERHQVVPKNQEHTDPKTLTSTRAGVGANTQAAANQTKDEADGGEGKFLLNPDPQATGLLKIICLCLQTLSP